MELDLGAARKTFIAESQELLTEMESSLLELERDPVDQNAINSLFRAAHTIKGSSGVLGIGTVERFTHFVENLLEKMRTGNIKASSENIELLLQCRDHIACLISMAAEEVEGLSGDALNTDSDAWHISIRFGRDLLRGGIDPISFISYLGKLGEITSITTLFYSMPEAAEMDPEDCYLGFEIDIKTDFRSEE